MNSSDHTVAIIVAAGRGTRAGGDLPKQWQMLNGQPVLAHTLAAFAGLPRVLVIHPDDRARAEGRTRGLIKVMVVKGRPLGAGIVALKGKTTETP